MACVFLNLLDFNLISLKNGKCRRSLFLYFISILPDIPWLNSTKHFICFIWLFENIMRSCVFWTAILRDGKIFLQYWTFILLWLPKTKVTKFAMKNLWNGNFLANIKFVFCQFFSLTISKYFGFDQSFMIVICWSLLSPSNFQLFRRFQGWFVLWECFSRRDPA